MINHVRTLLANRSASDNSSPGYPGHEYSPPGYTPRPMDNNVRALHASVFGDSYADLAYRNLRLRQVMSLIHSLPELREYVTLLDSRITYSVARDDYFKQAAAGPSVVLLAGSGSIYFSDYDGSAISQRLKKQWQIAAAATNKATVTYYSDAGDQRNKTIDLTIDASNVSNFFPLPDAEISVAIDYNIGTIWNIDLLYFPAKSFKDLIEQAPLYVSRDVELLLFNPSSIEPVTSFSNLWFKHPDAKVRFGALMLAMAWYLEGLRN